MPSKRQKGSAFEREVCKALSQWITNGKRTDVFWRSAMSGGRATVMGGMVRQAGDITAVAPEGHELTDRFFIECKFNNTLEIEQFILGGYGKIARYWERAVSEAAKYERDPILIAKQNHTPIIVICKRNHLQHWFDPIADIFNHATKTYINIGLFKEWTSSPSPRRPANSAERAERDRRVSTRSASEQSAVRSKKSGRSGPQRRDVGVRPVRGKLVRG